MKLKNLILIVLLLLFVMNSFAQNLVTEIKAKDGVHYITTTIDYPITGTYLFEGVGEPIADLNGKGTGVYQLHEQQKRTMIWGIECDKTGKPKFIKGFDSVAYTLWFQYTTSTEFDSYNEWNAVEFSIHFITLKMYINGERVKDYTDIIEK